MTANDDNDDDNNIMVSVVPKLWARRPGGLIPVGERNMSLLQNAQTVSGAH